MTISQNKILVITTLITNTAHPHTDITTAPEEKDTTRQQKKEDVVACHSNSGSQRGKIT